MKRKWILVIYILLLLIFFKQTFNFFYNEWVISKYNRQDYSADVSALLTFNLFQPYIAHYNNGNIYYQEGTYDMAIEEYSTALKRNPPKYKECSIRINLALAMLALLGDDYAAPDKKDESIATLKEAREILLEDHCATEEGDGHNKTAEQLKEEIDKLLKELESQPQTSSGSDDNNTTEEQKKEDEFENSVREELQQNQSDAYKQREEGMQLIEELEQGFNFNYGEVIW